VYREKQKNLLFEAMTTNLPLFIIIEGLLILLFVFSLWNDTWKVKNSGVSLEVTRGESSMNALYIHYGLVTVIFTLIVQSCEELKGNQILFITVNYGILSYLYFLSSWFRNNLFFRMINKIGKD